MTKRRFLTMACSFILIMSLCSSCILFIVGAAENKKMRKNLTVEKGILPPDYGKDKSVMLVVKENEKSYDKYLVKHFDNYIGKKEYISEKQMTSEEFKDTKKYRYFFHFTKEGRELVNSDGSHAGGFNVRRFYIYDRLEKKKYENTYTSSRFAAMIKVYVENLNKEIEKNK